MTQSDAMNCVFCKQPIADRFFRFRGQTTCPNCAEQVRQMDEVNHPTKGQLLRAAGAAFGAAVICAIAWAVQVKATNHVLGIVAVAVGWAVVWAAARASGDRRGVWMQVIVCFFSVFAIYLGKNLTYGWAMWDEIAAQSDLSASGLKAFRILILAAGAVVAFQPMDLLWYGIVIYGGWRRCAKIPIDLEGPFGASPANQPATSLQFDRADFHNDSGKSE